MESLFRMTDDSVVLSMFNVFDCFTYGKTIKHSKLFVQLLLVFFYNSHQLKHLNEFLKYYSCRNLQTVCISFNVWNELKAEMDLTVIDACNLVAE